MAVLLAMLVSPSVATVAVFVSDPTAAGPTSTPKPTTADPPGPIGPGMAQVTTCPFAWHVQPEPATLPDTNVRPVGRVSVIVIGPVVGLTGGLTLDAFRTVSEYRAPVLPTANEPE
jgi:hypothetical protein